MITLIITLYIIIALMVATALFYFELKGWKKHGGIPAHEVPANAGICIVFGFLWPVFVILHPFR